MFLLFSLYAISTIIKIRFCLSVCLSLNYTNTTGLISLKFCQKLAYMILRSKIRYLEIYIPSIELPSTITIFYDYNLIYHLIYQVKLGGLARNL